MKIAIYGDSFGDDIEGWPGYLGEELKAQVDIYAEAGTSVDYSYLNFIKTHENYDLVFFCWTNESRTSLIIQHSKDEYKHLGEFHDFHSAKYNIQYNNNKRAKGPHRGKNNKWVFVNENHKLCIKFIRAESELAEQTLPDFRHTLKQQAMKDSVLLRRPDCVNIRSFPDFFDKDTAGMADIQAADLQHVTKDMSESYDYYTENIYDRKCHLSKTQNIEFTSYLIKHMQNDDFDIHSTMKDPLQYYTMSENLETSGFEIKWKII